MAVKVRAEGQAKEAPLCHEECCSACGKYRVLPGPLKYSGKEKLFTCNAADLRCDVPELVSFQARKWLVGPGEYDMLTPQPEKWVECTNCYKWRWVVQKGKIPKDWTCQKILGLNCSVPFQFTGAQLDEYYEYLEASDSDDSDDQKEPEDRRLMITLPLVAASPTAASLKREVAEDGQPEKRPRNSRRVVTARMGLDLLAELADLEDLTTVDDIDRGEKRSAEDVDSFSQDEGQVSVKKKKRGSESQNRYMEKIGNSCKVIFELLEQYSKDSLAGIDQKKFRDGRLSALGKSTVLLEAAFQALATEKFLKSGTPSQEVNKKVTELLAQSAKEFSSNNYSGRNIASAKMNFKTQCIREALCEFLNIPLKTTTIPEQFNLIIKEMEKEFGVNVKEGSHVNSSPDGGSSADTPDEKPLTKKRDSESQNRYMEKIGNSCKTILDLLERYSNDSLGIDQKKFRDGKLSASGKRRVLLKGAFRALATKKFLENGTADQEVNKKVTELLAQSDKNFVSNKPCRSDIRDAKKRFREECIREALCKFLNIPLKAKIPKQLNLIVKEMEKVFEGKVKEGPLVSGFPDGGSSADIDSDDEGL